MFGLQGISELQELPPGLMDMLASSSHVWTQLGQLVQNTVLVTIYKLVRRNSFLAEFARIYVITHALKCTNDEDVTNFRRIVHQWIDGFNLHNVKYDDVRHIPFSSRYFHMAWAFHCYALNSEMAAALHPDTDDDRHELALWLDDLLHHMHREVHNFTIKFQ